MRTPTGAIASPTRARCVRSAPPPTTSRWWRGARLTGPSSVTRTSGTWPARAPSSPPWAAATSTWVVSPSTSPCWPTAPARPTTSSPARPPGWPALPGDLARGDEVVRLAREAESRSGGVDVLVNNAANYLRASFDELSEAIWDASLDVNLKAPFLLAWHLGRAMRARGRGRIVNL